MITQIINDRTQEIKGLVDVKDIMWKSFYNIKTPPASIKKIKVVLVCCPCYGYGDISFCIKISSYLKDWYGCHVTIATSDPTHFEDLGVTKNIVILKPKQPKNFQCRRIRNLFMRTKLPVQDLIMVTPLQSDFEPSITDVRFMFPYATEFNTFFFSEYNPTTRIKNGQEVHHDLYNFVTGVGGSRLGLLLTDESKNLAGGRLPRVKTTPYALAYIAATIDGADKCFRSFVEMISKKYRGRHKNFDIVLPQTLVKTVIDKKLIKTCSKYFSTIILLHPNHLNKDDEVLYENDSAKEKSTLRFRANVLPLARPLMLRLMKYSVKDILLTGDQSITDVLSACKTKNIFYQIADWKISFGDNLGKYLPNKYLLKDETSCGSLKCIKYCSDNSAFIKKWDFRKLARVKLDGIMKYIAYKNKTKSNYETLEEIETILKTKRGVNTVKARMQKYDEGL